MACPFKLTICTTLVGLAIVAYWFHVYFSETTLDYILQFAPLPESTKDKLYLFLLGYSSQEIAENTCDTNETENNQQNQQQQATQDTTQSSLNITNNNTNQTNDITQRRNKTGDIDSFRIASPTSSSCVDNNSTDNKNNGKKALIRRQKREFQRHEIPTIVKVFKYIIMVAILYFHLELFYYWATGKCFAAQIMRFTQHLTGVEFDMLHKTAVNIVPIVDSP